VNFFLPGIFLGKSQLEDFFFFILFFEVKSKNNSQGKNYIAKIFVFVVACGLPDVLVLFIKCLQCGYISFPLLLQNMSRMGNFYVS
jgi:hypothetical protein